MPVCVAVTFTEHHKEHAISHNDDPDPLKHEHTCRHDDKHADQPVTVADLLDAYETAKADGDESPKWDALIDLYDRADDATRLSYSRIFLTIESGTDPAALTRAERAEFDRRTT